MKKTLYKLKKGKKRLFERKEIVDGINHFLILENPHNNSAMKRVL
jgi:superfamily I DNA/RNA helicase